MAIQTPGSGTAATSTSESQSAAGAPLAGNSERGNEGLADRLRTKASSSLSEQKDRATQGLGTILDAVRGTGRQLRERDQSGIAGYIDTAADTIERVTETLQRKGVAEILEDVQNFGRRRPALFIGLSLGAGVLGARFLKSSRGATARSPYQSASRSYDERDSYTVNERTDRS